MNISLGLRGRVRPTLPAHYLGSPIIMCRVDPDVSVRNVFTKFTPAAVGGLLYRMAERKVGHRIWTGMIGRRNLIVTSWVKSGVWDVDFGCGRAEWVWGRVPAMDGVVVVSEAGEGYSVEVCLKEASARRLIEEVGGAGP